MIVFWRKNMLGIGNKIKERRKELGWTQKQLADSAKIAQSEISRIETENIKDIETQRLRKLAKALNISTDWLLEMDLQEVH
jgi:transcriptional regulator with XRE-family HTH domain